jgi:Leucine-rich repeat (LRR) protein
MCYENPVATFGQGDSRRLSLVSDNLTDAGLEPLKGLTSLTELHLYGNNFTEARLAHVRGLPRLTELRLHGQNRRTEVTPATQSRNNLKLIALALHHLHDTYLL